MQIDPWTLARLGESIEHAEQARRRIEEAEDDGVVGELITAALLCLQSAWRLAHEV